MGPPTMHDLIKHGPPTMHMCALLYLSFFAVSPLLPLADLYLYIDMGFEVFNVITS